MSKFIDIISPIYQELLATCARRKIGINLDIQAPTLKITDDEKVTQFYKKELKRALKLCEPGDKITITETADRISVKNSSKTTLDKDTVEQLRNQGYEVRARFGFDTIVTMKL